ncbi:MFS transporter, DHA1 family, tetracycline resistance protein [Gemmobacter megaterium]|uniref:MFS transporter, DHA1 family, tetracycline resistance protein n=1 Tax=Gemmobacter megaterium TaxID=1086013 RepID=A0A1N7KBI8_9RHOB|nr:TCR/Tet family MFS transporter [Gemmobacter megaterium]GGE01243.1 tetracycline resistance MFS efflux pump [Gemmobacter megaterium]SIS58978.1 MFS transporter, DHA1 family, tetracycline resistance protein [Gemmobacter megaterium]
MHTLSPPDLPPVAPPVTRHAFIFVLITVLLDMVGFGIIIPVLPSLIEEVGHVGLAEAATIAGWMFFAFSMAQFLCAPLVGNLSDSFGRRPLLLLAIFGLGLDYVLSAWAPSLMWLFVGRVLAGVCGSSWVIANAYIADVTPPEGRAKAFGLMGAAFGVGFVIGPAIGGLLGELGPRVPFWAAAGISFLNFVYGWFVLPETLAPANRRRFEWYRANPFGVFAVFRSYPGVIPMCGVLFLFFFASAVYPAIWAFWGMAKFGWSEAIVGLTLAVFGLIMAGFQGLLTGPAVARWGEVRVAVAGLVCAVIAATGYGFVGTLGAVVLLMLVHGPEGFVHPMLMALMSKVVPENAQGELQGGISAVMNVAMLAGTVAFTQVFAYFMAPNAVWQTPDAAYFLAGGILALTLLLYLWTIRDLRHG